MNLAYYNKVVIKMIWKQFVLVSLHKITCW